MADSERSWSDRLNAAAHTISRPDADARAGGLLKYLGYDDGETLAAPTRARMLRAAATFRRLFRLPAPDAPGLVFFGAEADPARLGSLNAGLPVGGFSGSGLDPRRAFESCVGEGIEYLSQFAHPEDPLATGPIAAYAASLDPASHGYAKAALAAAGITADWPIAWMPVHRITDGAASWFPADLCLRRAASDFVPPLKLSTGCAAGVTPGAATLHAMLELIERDAVALWWRGGRRGRSIPAHSEAGQAAAGLLAQLRRGQHNRQTVLFDITTDLGVPVAAAFSTSPDGHGFALGLGARPTLADAVGSAIFELCQSELSLHVIAAKRRESGDSALNDSDQRQLARAALNPRACLLLQPDEAASAAASLAGDPISAIVQSLATHGIVAYSLDLTRPRFSVPVVRVLAPGLQSDPGEIVSDRLARTIAATGGGARHHGGIALL
ncbi:YcaO-like family protein [Rhodopila sp.]|uniref:YcaO-like family protein n=1 Tax=Rhodopila sp. TaxID=2480087 RepID=UPI003D0CF989